MNALYNQIETALTAQGWANGLLKTTNGTFTIKQEGQDGCLITIRFCKGEFNASQMKAVGSVNIYRNQNVESILEDIKEMTSTDYLKQYKHL